MSNNQQGEISRADNDTFVPLIPQNAGNETIKPIQVKIIIILLAVILAVGIANLVMQFVPARTMGFGNGAPSMQDFNGRTPEDSTASGNSSS